MGKLIKRKEILILFISCSYFMFISSNLIQFNNTEIDINQKFEKSEDQIPNQSVWYVTNESIKIDNENTVGAYHSWTWWVLSRDWCTYSNGVYYIMNIVMNNGKYIDIKNSDVNFVIENCTIINSDSD